MELSGGMTIAVLLIGVIQVILILSIVHISGKVDEICRYLGIITKHLDNKQK